MGHQVNFYWHGQDEATFFAAARQRSGDLCALRYTSPTEAFDPLQELPPIGEPGSFHVWLWDRSISKPPGVRWVEQQGYYTLDASTSEVIQLSRPYQREASLVGGRLWAELTGWSPSVPDRPFAKSPEFKKWFNSLADWIRRHYTRTSEGWYLGPEAKEFRERGGGLSHADFAPLVKILRH